MVLLYRRYKGHKTFSTCFDLGDKMNVIIKNPKTNLEKRINYWDYTKSQMLKIFLFYKNIGWNIDIEDNYKG